MGSTRTGDSFLHSGMKLKSMYLVLTLFNGMDLIPLIWLLKRFILKKTFRTSFKVPSKSRNGKNERSCSKH